MDWWDYLGKDSRGSRPRCVALVDGERDEVAGRLTALVGLDEVLVTDGDRWMPRGKPQGPLDKETPKEARLGNHNPLLPACAQKHLGAWWPAAGQTPNWDIASTCKVDGEAGLLLVEAKAHHEELSDAGKRLAAAASVSSRHNHDRIRRCISESSRGLSGATQMPLALSRDSHYQMSNRLAWAWKLTELGYPVVLVYLGFLDATDMRFNSNGKENRLIANHDEWADLVKTHGARVVPSAVWDPSQPWTVHGQRFLPLIRSMEVDYKKPIGKIEVHPRRR